LEASPGIEPGWKDLQSRFDHFSKSLILTLISNGAKKIIVNQWIIVAYKGFLGQLAAVNGVS
jgi:hypothetical protein